MVAMMDMRFRDEYVRDVDYLTQETRISVKRVRMMRLSRIFTWSLAYLAVFWADFSACNFEKHSSQFPSNAWLGKVHSSAFVGALDPIKEESVPQNTSNAAVEQPRVSVKDGKPQTLNQILIRAGKRGLGGGLPGAIAGMVQVITLMWLRTIINYQCRYGTTFKEALTTLRRDGGISRLYKGLSFALLQAPLARFVSTAANDGIESLLAGFTYTQDWGPGRTTVVASIVVGLWRMMLMPIDTMKTVLQVDSVEGFKSLMRRVKRGKINVLYQGAFANSLSAIMGHYPWFYTYNLLSSTPWILEAVPSQLLRNAGIGFVASIFSDTVINGIRVVKTTKQSLGSKHSVTYSEVIRMIVAADGWKGLFGRGLRTRILANALQSIVFTVIWRGLAERWKRKDTEGRESSVN